MIVPWTRQDAAAIASLRFAVAPDAIESYLREQARPEPPDDVTIVDGRTLSRDESRPESASGGSSARRKVQKRMNAAGGKSDSSVTIDIATGEGAPPIGKAANKPAAKGSKKISEADFIKMLERK